MYRSRGAIRHDTTYRWKREDSFGGCKSSQPVRHMDKDTFCALKRTGIAYYRVDEVDFFAIYVLPEDVWYIIPSEVVLRLKSNIRVAPGVPGQKYEAYMEAWELLKKGR